jgi:hypothetical protein
MGFMPAKIDTLAYLITTTAKPAKSKQPLPDNWPYRQAIRW